MNQEDIYSFNLVDTVKSFKLFPNIFKILWNVKKSHIILITICYVINGLLPAASILSTQKLLNSIQTSLDKSFYYVLYPLLIYLCLNVFGYVISQLNLYLESLFKIDVNYDVRLKILEKAQDLSISDFENSIIYDKLRRAQRESIDRPYMMFSITLNVVSQFLGLISVISIILYWKPWTLILILLIPIISTIYMTKIGHIQYKIEYNRAQERRKSWYFGYLMTNDIALKEIKLYNIGDYLIKKYTKLNKKFIKQDKEIIKKRTIASFLFQFLDQIVVGFILYLIVKDAYSGEILIGSTVAYITSLSNIKENTRGLLSLITSIYENNLYVKQLFDFLEMPVTDRLEITNDKTIEEIKSIEFINVSFKYPNRNEYVLKNITFKIEKGENISLVGENGSGKTTLVKLVLGFYDKYKGKILINGISIKEINQENLGKLIGVIFQDFNKYELSCRENIGMGNINFMNRDDKLKQAVNKAYANEMIENLPKGIDTQLGSWFEEGIQLSGGQWQRIALCRAFFKDADCYILDEPSSSLDPISEYEIFKNTSELTKDKISIFISHRLYNLREVSTNIFVLKQGELVEKGTHEKLIEIDGYYKYLYDLQNNINRDSIFTAVNEN